MKVTVELSDQAMTEILQGRRAQIAQRFLSGEWGVELETYEADQERERLRDPV